MNDSMLRKYARLIAAMGANVQPNQPVLLSVSVDQAKLAAMVTEECYKLGASWVRIDWNCQAVTKLHCNNQSLETLSNVPAWREAQLQQMVDELPARIMIASEDPDGLAGIDLEKVQKARQATYPITRRYTDQVENKLQWTIVAAASPEWAHKVFPEDDINTAVEKLWKYILDACHVTEDNDPVQAWKEHNARFEERCAWLNSMKFDYVTYKSSNGTDFRAGLIPEGVWCGGGETTIGEVFFNPNMPTEEIFISPMRGQAEGTLVSTKPLSYQGQLIENFSITFENGKAVSWKAEKGQEVLDRMIGLDEGAAYLGELALVPMSSPICRSGILYYETLFDENASCHVALGRGFNDCIEGYKNRTDEECKKLGVNDSMVHTDFMIGAPDMCITGWKNGVPTPIFVNGEWA